MLLLCCSLLRTLIKRFKELPDGVENPAKKAVPQIRVGDMIVGVNGVECDTFAQIVEAIRSSAHHVTLILYRGP